MKPTTAYLLRLPGALALALFCASSTVSRAGMPVPAETFTPLDDGKDVKAVAPSPAKGLWSYDISVPGWLADTAGTIGLNGLNTHVYTPMDFTIRHVDMMASLGLEVRYNDRWGFYSDMLYVKASEAIFPNGLVSKADAHLDQWIADFEFNYRAIEGPKGYLDLRAGVRYQDIYSQIIVNANNKAIDQAAQNFVDEASAKVADRLSALNLKSRLAPLLADLIRKRLVNQFGGLQRNGSSLPIAPIAGGELSHEALEEARRAGFRTSGEDALTVGLENAIQAKVAPELSELESELRTQLAATTAALKAAAQSRIDALKRRIASDIAATVKKELNTSASLNNRWLDPYVGFAFRYDLDKVFYLTGKADIGGFGVGSELTWQTYIALGCQITHAIYIEGGYRYLYTDYTRSGGFLYDVTQSGAQITMGMRF